MPPTPPPEARHVTNDADSPEYWASLATRRRRKVAATAAVAASVVVLTAAVALFSWPARYVHGKANLGIFGVWPSRTELRSGKVEIRSCGEWQEIGIDGTNVTFPPGTRFCF